MPEPPDSLEPWWTRGEFAWACSIGVGFVATWLGLQVALPGFAALLSSAAFAPIYVDLLRREKRSLMLASSVVWALGSLAAVVGVVYEAPIPQDFAARLPGAHTLLQEDFGFLQTEGLLEPGIEDPPPIPRSTLPRNLFACLLVVALARPVGGVFALLMLANLLGAVGGALGAAGFAPGTSGLIVLCAIPPHLLLWILAGLLGAAAVSEMAFLPKLAPLTCLRRRFLLAALALACLAFAGHGMWIRTWRSYLADGL